MRARRGRRGCAGAGAGGGPRGGARVSDTVSGAKKPAARRRRRGERGRLSIAAPFSVVSYCVLRASGDTGYCVQGAHGFAMFFFAPSNLPLRQQSCPGARKSHHRSKAYKPLRVAAVTSNSTLSNLSTSICRASKQFLWLPTMAKQFLSADARLSRERGVSGPRRRMEGKSRRLIRTGVEDKTGRKRRRRGNVIRNHERPFDDRAVFPAC